ncbi:MAG: DUF2085 domain-containing protein [Oscillospiraceae bacterium]|nr:DUF2085 domain-containing protein [Oscillospiraceae bacterium]
MRLGQKSGCHQMPERSFRWRGRSFPICTRCTGVLIGNVIAYALFLMWAPPWWVCVTGCAVIFADWLVQQLKVRESTNPRRLITGIIGGYSLSTLYCAAIKIALLWLPNLFAKG